MNKIPFLNIDRIYKVYGKELLAAVEKTFIHGQVLMGPEITAFEALMTARSSRRYAVAVGSCTDALFFSLKAAGIKEGDEVLVTGFSFIASVSAIIRAGAVPVFVDINSDDFMMNVDSALNKLTSKTKAIVAVHLFGQSLPIGCWTEFAQAHGLLLLEDAAQSFGSRWDNTPVGKMGLASCVSFDPTKVVGAFGNGGVVLTDDERLAGLVRQMHYHGKDLKGGDFQILGYNSRMASSQAAMLICQFNYLDSWIERRREIARQYAQGLADVKAIKCPLEHKETHHVYHKYVMRVENRDALKKHLESQGVATMIHYQKALYEQPVCHPYAPQEALVNIERAKKEVISLPIYPEMIQEEIDQVITSVKEFYR